MFPSGGVLFVLKGRALGYAPRAMQSARQTTPPLRRYFCVDQANAFVPTLEQIFSETRKLHAHLERLVNRLDDMGHPPDPHQLEVDTNAPRSVQEKQRQLLALVDELDERLLPITEAGVEVRHAAGLVDFYSRRRGKEVCLCWEWGETSVSHFHYPDDGFEGRRPINKPQEFEGDLLI